MFGVLKTERSRDYVFDLDRALSFDGETSPYMQYTYARSKSILSKANVPSIDFESDINDVINDDTYELIIEINKFGNIIEDAANKFEPSIISKYLLGVCSLFNKFYNNYRIFEGDKISYSRLAVVKATSNILYTGLKLLNIDPVEKM